MPRVDFCFQGYVLGASVDKATDVNGKEVDVSKMNAKTLADKLEKGELFISLGDHLYEGRKNECKLHDFQASD